MATALTLFKKRVWSVLARSEAARTPRTSARRDKSEIGYEEIDYSIDRLTVGMQKTTGKTFPNRQVRTLGAARGPDPHSGPRPRLPPHPALP